MMAQDGKDEKMVIRSVTPEDAKTVVKLMRDTIRKVNIKDYTKEQVDVWSSKNTAKRFSKKFDDRSIVRVVAVVDSKIVGIACLKVKKNELSGLYVKSDMHGKGIGSRLLRYIESCARKNGLEHIRLYSTLTAVDFYTRYGYKRVRTINHLFDNVMVPCVLMKKDLD